MTEFYDHFLRNGHDFAGTARLFATAEYARAGDDPEALLKGFSQHSEPGQVL